MRSVRESQLQIRYLSRQLVTAVVLGLFVGFTMTVKSPPAYATTMACSSAAQDAHLTDFLMKRYRIPDRQWITLGAIQTTSMPGLPYERFVIVNNGRRKVQVTLFEDASCDRAIVGAYFDIPASQSSLGTMAFDAKCRESSAKILPENVRPYVLRAQGAASTRQYDKAAELYRNALRLAPCVPGIYYNLAEVLADSGRYEDAVNSMQRYLLLAPRASNARSAQDQIYVWQGREPAGE